MYFLPLSTLSCSDELKCLECSWTVFKSIWAEGTASFIDIALLNKNLIQSSWQKI